MAFSLSGIRSWWPGGVGAAARASHDATSAEDGDRPRRLARSGRRSPPPDDGAGEPATGQGKPIVRGRAREAAALLLIACGLYAALALGSYRADPLRPEVGGGNWVGPVGEVLARGLVWSLGVVAWLVPVGLMLLSRPLLAGGGLRPKLKRLGGDVLVLVILASLAHIALPRSQAFGAMPLGGAVGELSGSVGRGLFSTVGSFLIGLTVVALILVERSAFSFIALGERARAGLSAARRATGRVAARVAQAWARARIVDRERREQERRANAPIIATADRADAIIAAFADDCDEVRPRPAVRLATAVTATTRIERAAPPSEPSAPRPEPPAEAPAAAPAGTGAHDLVEAETPSPILPGPREHETPSLGAISTSAATTPVEPGPTEALAAPPNEPPAALEAGERPRRRRRDVAPRIVDTSAAARTEKARERRARSEAGSRFVLPPTDLLEPVIGSTGAATPEQLMETARLLEKTLGDYKVQGKVLEIQPGPTVTTYEVSPAAGTKVSSVAKLADDLALGMARKVRIIAPIPGKNRIGFEVPNDTRVPVNLRELVDSQDFMAMKAPLPCVLGRDIIGRPFFADLAAMPHVIIAGATGAGKSIGLSVMLVSLLYRRTPDEMRLLMIDPKVVELAPFDRIPHLLFPVVTDMKQAANALKWAVDEMERRYQKFADAGTRDIVGYNRWVKRVRAGELPHPPGPAERDAIAPDGSPVRVPAARDGSDAELPTRLPYVVIVVEEFADLMTTHGKEVETAVARLAQKARAAGMHVILATQRPSVDVITGTIKANFPTRIAYRVAQKVDSRTIIDEQGAEHLLGMGDMLIKLNGTGEVKRVQCPFVSEVEVQRTTDMLRRQGEPEYDPSIVMARDEEGAEPEGEDGEADPKYDEAVRVVAETKKCSTSWIQRKLGIGYNRAAKIVETMERNGLVGPQLGTRPRDIFVSPL